MKPKQLNSTLMPFAFFGLGVIWLVSLGVLIWSQLMHPNGGILIAIFVYLIFGLYIWILFNKHKTIKCDHSSYYLTNMLTNKTEVIKIQQLITIRPIKYVGLLTPWNKVFVYKDENGIEKKALFVEKLGLL